MKHLPGWFRSEDMLSMCQMFENVSAKSVQCVLHVLHVNYDFMAMESGLFFVPLIACSI